MEAPGAPDFRDEAKGPSAIRKVTGSPEFRIFVFLALFYALGTGGHVYTPDGVVMGRVAESIATGHGFAADPEDLPAGFVFPGRDGRFYGKYGPGLSFVSVPAALIGRLLCKVAPSWSTDVFAGPTVFWYRTDDPISTWDFFAFSLVNGFVTALLAALLYRLARRIGHPPGVALGVAGIAALASPLWPYAKDYFAEPLGALGIVGFALAAEEYAALGGGRRPGAVLAGPAPGPDLAGSAFDSVLPEPVPDPSRRIPARGLAFAAGLSLGLSVCARIAHLAVLPVGGAVMLWILLRAGGDREDGGRRTEVRDRVADGALFAAGIGLMLALIAWFNLARFGHAARTGYEAELNRWDTPIATGLNGLLFSPGRGLLTCFPVALLALVLARASWRRSPRMTILGFGTLLSLLAVYCRWYAWNGGWAWGPRFLVPAVPLLALSAAPFLASPPRRAVLRWIGWLLVLGSFWIAFTATWVPTSEFHHRVRLDLPNDDYLTRIAFDWRYYTPVAYVGFRPKSFYLIARALRVPVGWWLSGLFGLGLVWLAPLCAAAVRRGLDKPGARVSRRRLLIWTGASLGAGAILALISWNSGPHVLLEYNFEGTSYGPGWVTNGAAFGPGPARGGFGAQELPVVYGRGLVNTYLDGSDAAVGTMRSPDFLIRGDLANFFIGGTRDSARIAARLVVDGREVARATGPGGDNFIPIAWDLSSVAGRRAHLELIDASPEGHSALR